MSLESDSHQSGQTAVVETHETHQKGQTAEQLRAVVPSLRTLRQFEGPKTPILSRTPDFLATDVAQIKFGELNERHGVNTVLFDLDHTLAETGGTAIRPDLLACINQQRAEGYIQQIYVATDRRGDVSHFTEPIEATRIDTPLLFRKHTRSYWNEVKQRLKEDGHNPHQAVMIGDSRRDIRGPNSIGLLTVAVRPFSRRYAPVERAIGKPWLDNRWRASLERIGRELHPPLTGVLPLPNPSQA